MKEQKSDDPIREYFRSRNKRPSTWRDRLFVRNRGARGVLLLTLVTLVYLLLEFAFSAWLLDVMAADSSPRDIEMAERRGRVISGFAVALLFWPVIFARTQKWWVTAFTLVGVSIVVMVGVYHGERKLVDSLVERSSEQSRAAAVTGSLLRQGLATGSVGDKMLDGLWADDKSQSTAGKAFVGVVAYMASQSSSAQRQTMAIAPEVIKGVIEQKSGGLEAEYGRFVESQDTIRRRYKYRYLADLEAYAQRLEGTRKSADRAWEHYLDKLEVKNPKWGRARIGKARGGELVPGFVAPSVRRAVREEGIPVTDSWSTGDKATFVRLHEEQQRSRLKAGLEKALDGLPTNASLETFAAHRSVQSLWRDSLKYPQGNTPLTLAPISQDEFSKRYYQPLLVTRTRDQLKNYENQAGSYGDGRKQEEKGKLAYEAMIAPVFALTLSLIGALVHLGKTGLLMTQVVSGWRFRSGLVKGLSVFAGVLLITVVASFTLSTPITSHPTYQAWTQSEKSSQVSIGDRVVIFGLDAMIKMQSVAYPVFDLVRRGVATIAKKAGI